jgi:hypothetical protein
MYPILIRANQRKELEARVMEESNRITGNHKANNKLNNLKVSMVPHNKWEIHIRLHRHHTNSNTSSSKHMEVEVEVAMPTHMVVVDNNRVVILMVIRVIIITVIRVRVAISNKDSQERNKCLFTVPHHSHNLMDQQGRKILSQE